ncbi:hypothetical protein Fmac_025879 [Flemingia macrophylla]|uniref:Uncharacterized protein n=1 Tax=Flemingia macrophylla TaxID=520843 RepID=A0ABD1LEV8_9FABA
MEGFPYERPKTNYEQIDLTLKLSLSGQNAAAEEEKMVVTSSSFGEKEKSGVMGNGTLVEGDKVLVMFEDLQTMRRVRTGKRLLLKKMQRAAAAKAGMNLFPEPITHPFQFANASGGYSWQQGGASSDFQTLYKQENDAMVSPQAMQEMRLWPSGTMIERPWTF